MGNQEKLSTASIVVLVDTSGSMNEGGKIHRVRDASANLKKEVPGARVFAFACDVREVESLDDLPHPAGSTDMTSALKQAANLMAGQTFVVSDGLPDDPESALAAAREIPGVINILYCGDDSDKGAIVFMQRLARENGGSCVVRNLRQHQLMPAMRELLGLPAPIAL
jgi:Mg-chelatase subunit ChlD